MTRNENGCEDLLDVLAKDLNCPFLSDLIRKPYIHMAFERLETYQFSDFPDKQWRDAIFYLTGENQILETEEKLRAFLAQYGEQSGVCPK